MGSEPALKLEIFPFPFVIEEMYGRKACQLVKEFATSEKGQLKPFNVSVPVCKVSVGNVNFKILMLFFNANAFCSVWNL